MQKVFDKLSSSTLRIQIVEKVKTAILTGTLSEGERLERDLAAQLGTSLTAVRDALIQLEAEGFITEKPNTTTHVTKLFPKEIVNLCTRVRENTEKYPIVL